MELVPSANPIPIEYLGPILVLTSGKRWTNKIVTDFLQEACLRIV